MDSEYLYMPQGLETLRRERFTSRKRHFQRLVQQCQLYEKQELPKEHPLKSITYYGMAAANLSLAYKLTGQKAYLSQARRWIFAGVDYPHWGKAVKVDVDLSAAWLLFGYGLSYDWLKGDLEPADRQALLKKLILQGGRMYQYALKTGAKIHTSQRDSHIQAADSGERDVLTGHSWATSYWQNHNWIDFTGLAMAGYAIVGEYPPAQEWIDLARENFQKVFPLLPDDGSDYEGVVYWRYGVVWLFHYAELLREKEGTDWFADSKFLKNTFFYRLYELAPDREQNFNHGDCHDRRSGHIPCLYYKAAAEYQNGYAQALADEVLENCLFREGYESGVKPGILPEAFLEYLWYNPAIEPKPLENLPLTVYFPDLGLVCSRTSWERDAVAFSYKCAPGGGHKQWKLSHAMEQEAGIKIRSTGHHHPDANSFMLIRGSDFLAVDEGYSSRKAARNHNLILIDGQGFDREGGYDAYDGWEESQTAQVETFIPYENGFYLCGESAGMYSPALGVSSVKRHILTSGEGWFLILDAVSSEREHTYTWLLHSDQAPKKMENRYHFENGGSVMEVLPGDMELRFGSTVMTNSANVTSQEPDNIVYTRLETLCQENKLPAKEMRFLNLVSAGDAGRSLPECSMERQDNGWLVHVGDYEITVCAGYGHIDDIAFTVKRSNCQQAETFKNSTNERNDT